MIRCIQTDINEFALHLSGEELDALVKKLSGTDDKLLHPILKAIRSEKLPVAKAGFERRRTIKLCHKCGGSGRIRIGNLQNMDYDYDDCPFCYGAGNVVEKSTVTYERITPYVKNSFAR